MTLWNFWHSPWQRKLLFIIISIFAFIAYLRGESVLLELAWDGVWISGVELITAILMTMFCTEPKK
jgi:Na+/proline symporter